MAVNLGKSTVSSRTGEQYERQISTCREVFLKKAKDYGTSWRVMRLPSLVDQIFIKAQRIRSLEETREQKVDDPIDGEYCGIINYSIMTLIQMDLGASMETDSSLDKLMSLYNQKAEAARELMERKNHDYGEAWREMQITSFTDLILAKLLRIRQILQNDGKTLISEGIEANLYDMINYAVFALIKMEEGWEP